MSLHTSNEPIRVLYSFALKLGDSRIGHTSWHQVNGVAAAGASVLACPGVLHRPVAKNVTVWRTLSWKRLRISYKLVGRLRSYALHDWIVARRLEQLKDQIDIVHAWPLGALETLKTARRLGIPTVLERPNTHTRYAFEVVRRECERLGVDLPADHEHSYNPTVLEREEQEYHLADRLLCPSDFVLRTFLDQGFDRQQLSRHSYGYDESVCFPDPSTSSGEKRGLVMLFAGECAVRKGLHFALEAWLKSPAHHNGRFLIAGNFLPDYSKKLSTLLQHPSVQVLGHRKDLPQLMRQSDVFVLPSIEEGSALVTYEARGSGCVLLVSEAAGAPCRHMENGLVHTTGDVATLTEHITALHEDQKLHARLREASLSTVNQVTWKAAGRRLLDVYREVLETRRLQGFTRTEAADGVMCVA
jgi:glycosyltransferase involved in cell wall biosynthesis